MIEKKTILILFGGCSSEYEISLQSAYSVLTYMEKEKYNVVSVGITRDGKWLHFSGSPEKLTDDTWMQDDSCIPAILSPDRTHHGIMELAPEGNRLIPVDIAFPVLHGRNGEDGTIQGLIQLAGIPLIGCGTLSSALCMDKNLAHKLVENAGIAVPAAISITLPKNICPEEKDLFYLTKTMHYPLFVKPVRAGSSYGISKIYDKSQLPAAIEEALKYDNEIMIEENIDGFEVGCAVMNDKEGGEIIGRVDEIELACGFFDYTKKYTEVDSKIHMPARIDPHTESRIKDAARTIYKTLGCCGFARVDMFLTPTGKIVFNEVNTIPGFTSHSRFPKMLEGVGISFHDILENLITVADK